MYNPEQPKIVKSWSRGALQSIKSKYLSVINSKNRSGDGIESLKVAHKMDHGEVTRVSFKMARHLVFVHGGFGKGVAGKKGSTWTTEKGQRKKTNPSSLGASRKNRHPKEWFTPVIKQEMPKLMDAMAKEKLDAAFKAVMLK